MKSGIKLFMCVVLGALVGNYLLNSIPSTTSPLTPTNPTRIFYSKHINPETKKPEDRITVRDNDGLKHLIMDLVWRTPTGQIGLKLNDIKFTTAYEFSHIITPNYNPGDYHLNIIARDSLDKVTNQALEFGINSERHLTHPSNDFRVNGYNINTGSVYMESSAVRKLRKFFED
jgi:hypothetical protein